MLMVGVFGPKYPCEEVFIKHVGSNQYNVQYVRTLSFGLLHMNSSLSLFSRPYEKKVNICWLLNGAINIFQVLLGISKSFKEQNVFNEQINLLKKFSLIFFYLYAYMLENFVSIFLYIFFSLIE